MNEDNHDYIIFFDLLVCNMIIDYFFQEAQYNSI